MKQRQSSWTCGGTGNVVITVESVATTKGYHCRLCRFGCTWNNLFSFVFRTDQTAAPETPTRTDVRSITYRRQLWLAAIKVASMGTIKLNRRLFIFVSNRFFLPLCVSPPQAQRTIATNGGERKYPSQETSPTIYPSIRRPTMNPRKTQPRRKRSNADEPIRQRSAAVSVYAAATATAVTFVLFSGECRQACSVGYQLFFSSRLW